jgi:hypothetical protein
MLKAMIPQYLQGIIWDADLESFDP